VNMKFNVFYSTFTNVFYCHIFYVFLRFQNFKFNVFLHLCCCQLLYAETPSNPLMTVLDLEEFGQLGNDDGGGQADRLTVVDATFASPHLLKPMKYGVDIVIHSAYVYYVVYLKAGVKAGCVHLCRVAGNTA